MRLFLAILILFFFSSLNKPVPEVENYTYKLKAAFIYNFATLVDWPANRKTGDFIIAVYGDKPVYEELKKRYSVKSIGAQKIKVVEYTSKDQISSSHILFVGESKKNDVSAVKNIALANNTLLVSEAVGGLSKGAVINFMGPSGVNYEISKGNAKKNKLVVASRLLNLAKNVE